MIKHKRKPPPPSYKDEKKTRLRSRTIVRWVSVAFLLLIFVAGIGFLMFFAGIFNITTTTITGPDSIDKQTIRLEVDRWLSEKHFLVSRRRNSQFLSMSDIEGRLKRDFARIANASAILDGYHHLLVTITERKPIGIMCTAASDNCFFFDSQAVAFLATNPSSGSLFAIVEDPRNQIVNIGKTVMNTSMLNTIQLTRHALQYAGLSFDKFILSGVQDTEFDVRMREGWALKLSTKVSANEQIEAMMKFFKEKLSETERAKLDYVDLRIKDRIYYQ